MNKYNSCSISPSCMSKRKSNMSLFNNLQIKEYVLDEIIGRGSFGKVRVGIHTTTNYKVAIKNVIRQQAIDQGLIDKIRREIQLMMFLSHPHINKMYDVICTPTDFFMVMEYVSGGDLLDYLIERGTLDVIEARRFFQQLISGVSYFHQFNVIHRDLKPENILLDSYNNIKIADFGLSNIIKDGEHLRTSCGSPNYASPEIVKGVLYTGPEVDIWSCGVILFLLLSGRLPFDDSHTPTLFSKIIRGKFVYPYNFPVDCKSLIDGMLTTEAINRFSVRNIREHEWFKVNQAAYLFQDYSKLQTKYDEDILCEMSKLMLTPVSSIKERLITEPVDTSLTATYRILIGYLKPFHYVDQILPEVQPPCISSSTCYDDILGVETIEKVNHQWHIGIAVTGIPPQIINVVYAKLISFKHEWRTIKPYKVEIKCKEGMEYVYCRIELMRLDQVSYILDFTSIKNPLNNVAEDATKTSSLPNIKDTRMLRLSSNESDEGEGCNAMKFINICNSLIISLIQLSPGALQY